MNIEPWIRPSIPDDAAPRKWVRFRVQQLCTSRFPQTFASNTVTLMSLEVCRPSKVSWTVVAYETSFRGVRYCTASGRPLVSCSTFMSFEVARSSKITMAMLTSEAEFIGDISLLVSLPVPVLSDLLFFSPFFHDKDCTTSFYPEQTCTS